MSLSTETASLHDLAWIRQTLQSAIELEYSTLPLYLWAMFSLEVQNYTAYNTIRSVAMEEMTHVALASNLLAALGGTPAIKNLQIQYPTQGLPGGVEPDLRIGLARYSEAQLKNFMRLEQPEFLTDAGERREIYPTIGTMYDAMKSALRANRDDVVVAVKKATNPANNTASKQVPDSIGLRKFSYDPDIDPVEMLCAGIDEITHQGEGGSIGSVVTGSDFEYEESHYAKFASLYYGYSYLDPGDIGPLTSENEALFFRGSAIAAPAVMNILAVPADGYEKILVLDDSAIDGEHGGGVRAQLDAFDTAYSNMLMTLDTVWNPLTAGSWRQLSPNASKMVNYRVFQNTATLQEQVGGLGSAVHAMMDFRVFTSFNLNRLQVSDSIVRQLSDLYPDEFEYLEAHTDLSEAVFFGPRFRNTNR